MSEEKKKGNSQSAEERTQIDLEAQMKQIESQIMELQGQYKMLQAMKENDIHLMAKPEEGKPLA